MLISKVRTIKYIMSASFTYDPPGVFPILRRASL